MRVLVVGSVPPPAGDPRESLLAEIVALRTAGHDVEIAAPNDLAVAHRYLSSGGVAGAIEVAVAARRADAVVVQLEPGLPVRAGSGRIARAAALLALAAVLRRTEDVRLRLDHLDDLPGGPGGRAALELWRSARRIELGDGAARDELLAALGPLGDRLVVVPRSQPAPSVHGLQPPGWGDGADATAEHVMSVVRRRAAAERAAIVERAGALRATRPGAHAVAAGGVDHPPRHVPLWQWLPAPGLGVPAFGDSSGTGALRQRPLAHRAAVAVLAAAERRSATRPLAHLARKAWLRLGPALRS